MVAVPEDMDVVVAEIVSVAVEVATAVVVDTSSAEDVAAIVMCLTLLVLLLMLLPLIKDMVLLNVNLLNLPQVMVVDRVLMWIVPLAVATILLVLSEDGKAMVLSVKAAVHLLLFMWASTVRVKVTRTKNAKNTATLKEKNSVVTNSRNIAARKDKLKEKTSVMQKAVIKKWNKLQMPIGLMNLASDIMLLRNRNSANWTMHFRNC